jgi:hypothetical protein
MTKNLHGLYAFHGFHKHIPFLKISKYFDKWGPACIYGCVCNIRDIFRINYRIRGTKGFPYKSFRLRDRLIRNSWCLKIAGQLPDWRDCHDSVHSYYVIKEVGLLCQ